MATSFKKIVPELKVFVGLVMAALNPPRAAVNESVIPTADPTANSTESVLR